MMTRVFLLFFVALLAACSKNSDPVNTADSPASDVQDSRPNILLIIADDLGYADLGSYGGEINTPNLDALAESGVQLTNFHAAPSCSPTRSMIMTGVDNHQVGLGVMAESQSPALGQVGYEGYLNHRAATLPELLVDAGYHTYMTGKWHLGYKPDQLPSARGFEKTFTLLGGGSHHLENMSVYGPKIAGTRKGRYRENGAEAEVPEDFYSTQFFTDKLIEYIDSGKDSGKPFFGYLAYTAPHWPLQAPDSSIDKYKGRYDAGYDALLAERVERMKARGLIPDDVEYRLRPEVIAAWDALSPEQKKVEARAMEVYAAMVDDIDTHVGRLMEYLKSIGEYDNTLVVFISDNGPAPSTAATMPPILREWYEECCNTTLENMGRKKSWVFYGVQWAIPGSGHLRATKGFVSEGGTRVPAIISYPGLEKNGTKAESFATVKDLLPTFLELAGAEHPGTEYKGREVLAVQGESLLPALSGKAETFHSDDYYSGWEVADSGAVTQGNWKLLREKAPFGEMTFQLYNLADDPGEVNDMAESHPEKFEKMKQLWERYRQENGVVDIH